MLYNTFYFDGICKKVFNFERFYNPIYHYKPIVLYQILKHFLLNNELNQYFEKPS
jgi:hypothetical protein